MAKIWKNESEYKIPRKQREIMLNDDHKEMIMRLSCEDIIRSMPIEDIKKIFMVKEFEPEFLYNSLKSGSGIEEDDIYNHRFRVSIKINDDNGNIEGIQF